MLTRYRTMAPVGPFRHEVDDLLTRFFGERPATRRRSPPLNVWQDENAVYLEAELPGVSDDDVELTVEDDEVTIRGTRPPLEPAPDTVFLRRERICGEFGRGVRLPVPVDASKVEASLVDGVLKVTLPRAQTPTRQRILIKEQTR